MAGESATLQTRRIDPTQHCSVMSAQKTQQAILAQSIRSKEATRLDFYYPQGRGGSRASTDFTSNAGTHGSAPVESSEQSGKIISRHMLTQYSKHPREFRRSSHQDRGYLPAVSQPNENIDSAYHVAVAQTLHQWYTLMHSFHLQHATFNINWNLRDFLVNKYEAGFRQKLDKIIVITGETNNAKLSPVGEYFKWCWPYYSKQLLFAI